MWTILSKWLVFIPLFFLLACRENSSAGLKNIYVGEGIASWYGIPFDGRRTANGDTFKKDSLTAAHRILEFGTLLKVTNLQNSKEIVVEINDRGPFTKTRILDLSEKAAREIGIFQKGFGLVKIEICGYDKVDMGTIIRHYKNIYNLKKEQVSVDLKGRFQNPNK